MILLLAIRNILKNKKDSFIVILLIAVITFLFFIGNTIIGKASMSLRSSYIESLTGDVVLQKKGDFTMNLFGANIAVIDEFFNIPVLPAYNTIMDILKNEKNITMLTSQVSGTAFMDFLDVRESALLCGIDPQTYFSLFPGIILLEGNLLKTGEYGAMITEERAQRIEAKCGIRSIIGMPALFTTGGAAGFKIREVPIVGIFRYQNPGYFMNDIVIIDPQTVRELNSIKTTAYIDSDELYVDFFNVDIDSIFSEDFTADYSHDDTSFSSDYLIQFLSESNTETVAQTSGDWHFIIIRLNKSSYSSSFISSLNKKLEHLDIVAVDWRTASGASSVLSLLIQFLFNCGIFLISITGIIAVINIHIIYVFRRVREIGTLRAIGARDFFIKSLIFCENTIYSLIAGFTGVIAGYIFINWINNRQIKITNEILITLFNGSILYFNFLPYVAVIAFFIALALGLAATIYPVEIAVRIKPVVAVRRG